MNPRDPTDLPDLGHEDDPFAPPTEEELEAAARLRDALDHGSPDPDAELARALRAAHAPTELDAARNEALLARALGKTPPRTGAGSGGTVVRFRAAAVLVLAAAAGFALVLGPLRPSADEPVAAVPELVPCRSTAQLFDEPFPRAGGSSSRIDRIALARAHDLRENRFAQWGVR